MYFGLQRVDPSGKEDEEPCCCEGVEEEVIRGSVDDPVITQGDQVGSANYTMYDENIYSAGRVSWEGVANYSGNAECGQSITPSWNVQFDDVVEINLGVGVELGVTLGAGPFYGTVKINGGGGGGGVTASVIATLGTINGQRCRSLGATLFAEKVEAGKFHDRFNYTPPYGVNTPAPPDIFVASSAAYTGNWKIIVRSNCCVPEDQDEDACCDED